jgi:hypothetical protein
MIAFEGLKSMYYSFSSSRARRIGGQHNRARTMDASHQQRARRNPFLLAKQEIPAHKKGNQIEMICNSTRRATLQAMPALPDRVAEPS